MAVSGSLGSSSNPLASLLSGLQGSSGSSTTSQNLNSSAAGITFGGIASGIDTNGIIQKLVQIEQQPISRLQQQKTDLQNTAQIYTQLQAQVTTLSSAASTLNNPNTFNPTKTNSSSPLVATVSSTSTSQPGTYSLTVNNLAQAQKIASKALTDTTTGLGLSSGTFVIGGQAINVDGTDSLSSIAQKINSTGAGVTASLIDGGTGNAYLTLTSSQTGVANGVQIADLTGTTASTLGLTSGAATVRSAITNGAESSTFSSNSNSLASMFGNNVSGTVSFGVGPSSGSSGTVTLDLATDTLQTVADKINSLGNGTSASVVSVKNGSTTSYKLDITAAGGTTFSDPNNFLQSIGVLQSAPGNELIAAKDASFKLDTINLTSASNTVTTAIPGATINLLKNDTTTNTTTISIATDTSAIQSSIQNFVSDYNNLTDFISQNSQFDATTGNSGPLFGDSVAQQVQDSLANTLFNNVPGLTGNYTNLTSIGFSIDSSGHMQLDTNALNTVLATNPQTVGKLFEAAGTASNGSLTYVSSSSKSVPSGTTPYNVNITQAATTQNFTAGTAQTSANSISEKLTFNGTMFGSSGYALNLDIGSTLDSLISKINSDATLAPLVSASAVDGKLNLVSKRYGSAGNFTVASNQSSSSTNSGVGVGGEGTTVAGIDVAGTINGEAATGTGQFLLGNAGNTKTDGLQIQYTGTATGDVGTMSFANGIAQQVNTLLSTFTDSVNGSISIKQLSLTGQETDIQTHIDDLNKQLTTYETQLQTTFANMETAISNAQQQGQQIAAGFK